MHVCSIPLAQEDRAPSPSIDFFPSLAPSDTVPYSLQFNAACFMLETLEPAQEAAAGTDVRTIAVPAILPPAPLRPIAASPAVPPYPSRSSVCPAVIRCKRAQQEEEEAAASLKRSCIFVV
ncbi:MAG: hypothetical protein P4L40_26630 [Terracidiphilus sp.]|nr:hypothetical protein [Terracidiphilus sp.]